MAEKVEQWKDNSGAVWNSEKEAEASDIWQEFRRRVASLHAGNIEKLTRMEIDETGQWLIGNAEAIINSAGVLYK